MLSWRLERRQSECGIAFSYMFECVLLKVGEAECCEEEVFYYEMHGGVCICMC